MMKRKLHAALLAATVALMVIVTGCILSGQFILVYPGMATINSSDAKLDPRLVNITEEEVWQDHKDKIQGIVDIKFECEFVNKSDADSAHGELYISSEGYTEISDVRTNATRVFSGLALGPGETKPVSFSESSAYIENLETVLDLLEDGEFWIYGIVPATDEPYELTIQGKDGGAFLRLMITFSAGS